MRLFHKLALAVVLMSLVVMLLPLSVARADTVVNFPDPNLQAAIRQAIGKPTGDIYQSDLDRLTMLFVGQRYVVNLTGLEHCTSLTGLSLAGNQISDISSLSSLTSLTGLDLAFNQISDLSSLSSLTSLTGLDLDSNQISDISSLSSLTSLITLNLAGNRISDISSLSSLTSLTGLVLNGNLISDISPLSSLTSLTWLHLEYNQISDISPLSGLTSLGDLALTNNHISDISPLSGLTSLWELWLSSNRISDISPLSGLTSLAILELEGNQISDISSLSGLTSLTGLRLEANQISDISPLSGLTSLKVLYLGFDLGGNPISDISPLSGLTNLNALYLIGDEISDIKPLVDNPGFAQGDYVDLTANPLSSMSIWVYVPELVLRDVTVVGVTGGNQPPSRPTNISPPNGAIVVGLTPSLHSSAFSDPDAGQTHLASEWRITTMPDDYMYTGIVFDSGTDISDLTSINLPPGVLSVSTLYYWHVRYRDNLGAWSDWSVDTSFTTTLTPTPTPTTTPTPLTVTTDQAINVFSSSAILRGSLDGLGRASSVDVSFQWATDDYYTWHGNTYDQETSPSWPMTSTGSFSYSLRGLYPDTAYHFRVKAAGDSTVTGSDMTFTTAGPGSDGDGVPANVEDAAPNNGDGNYDGIPDSEQANVASLPNAVDGQYATIASPSGTSMTDVAAVNVNSLPPQGKPNLVFPYGLFSFNVIGIDAGSTAWVTLRFENPVPDGSEYWKYGPTTDNPTSHWYQITMNISDSGHVIQIPLIDGGLGDDDLAANGVIVDQGGLGNHPSPGGGVGVPVFPNVYIGIGAVLGAGVLAYFVRRKLAYQKE